MVIMLTGGGERWYFGIAKQTTNIFNIKLFLTWRADFFAFAGYTCSVLNLQGKYSQGNQIKTYLFERVKTGRNCSINKQKAERININFTIGRCESIPPIVWIYS